MQTNFATRSTKLPDNNSTERFPRTSDLPSQSPLFWVEQKDRYLRQLLIRDIEKLTGRRLIVYFANRFQDAQIDHRDCGFFTEIFRDIGNDPVDLLIETIGGFTDATESLVSLIQNLTKDFRVIVANSAKSNGTLLGLAAKSILMGAPSELGPIEPLVQGVPCSILIQPQIAAQNFPLHKYGEFALQQTRKLATTLLTQGMMKDKPISEVNDAVQKLCSRDVYFSHGTAINHVEAKTLGLVIDYFPPDDEIWKRIWLLHCMYEYDCNQSHYLKVFEGRAVSTAVAAPPKP
jgi:Serine dehydrogenase proteinase